MLATPGKQELWTCEHDGDLPSKKKLESKKYLGTHKVHSFHEARVEVHTSIFYVEAAEIHIVPYTYFVV